jgi:hypothetical protein
MAIATQSGQAHKAVTSKYTFNDDVFPIFRDKCARCHVEHGVAPMSLMTYKDAYPWAESIRAELVGGHMPPWNAEDGIGSLKHPLTLTARELDVILTWATGGNPQGDLDRQLPAVALKNDWVMGTPDLALPLPSEFTVPADKLEVTQEFTLPTRTTEPRWIRAVDLRPGMPSIVRSAVIFVKTAPQTQSAIPNPQSAVSSPEPDRVLALWVPGHEPEPLDAHAAFRLPAGAELGVRIHYRKTWQFEGQALADRSTVGVYFAPGKEAQELLALPLTSPTLPPADAPGRTIRFSHTIGEDVQALALSPDEVPPNITVGVTAILPDGTETPMIRLNTRADWARRYWFTQPLPLPRGSRVEVTAILENPDILSEAFGTIGVTKPPAAQSPLRLALNVIPARTKPTAP